MFFYDEQAEIILHIWRSSKDGYQVDWWEDLAEQELGSKGEMYKRQEVQTGKCQVLG